MQLLQRLTSSARALGESLETLAKGEHVLPEFRLRARQLAEQACDVTDHAKAGLLLRFMSDNPDRLIVFSEHLPTLELLEKKVKDAGRLAIPFTGSLSRSERSKRLNRFRTEPGSVFLATRAGSEGLNLQFCNQLVNYELPWNPMIIEQRIGRIHRIGQEREVHIVNLAARDTIEMHILRLLDQKIKLFQLVIGELDTILGEFGGAEKLEQRLTDAWLGAESDEAFEQRLEVIGEEILKSREAGIEQEKVRCGTCRQLVEVADPPDALVKASVAANDGDPPKSKSWKVARDATHQLAELDLGWSRRVVFAVRHGDSAPEVVMRHSLLGSSQKR